MLAEVSLNYIFNHNKYKLCLVEAVVVTIALCRWVSERAVAGCVLGVARFPALTLATTDATIK